MKPYYQEGGQTIYLGDFRDILPGLPKADLVVTDPPYNTPDVGPQHKTYGGGAVHLPPDEYKAFCYDWFNMASSKSDRLIFTPGIRGLWLYPEAKWVLCWHKPASVSWNGMGGHNEWEPILIYGKVPMPFGADHWTFGPLNLKKDEWTQHPCPKNPFLWAKLVEKVSRPGETILDPFMGSGTTLRAAKDLGRKAIGIDIWEPYCEMVAKRLSQEVMDLTT